MAAVQRRRPRRLDRPRRHPDRRRDVERARLVARDGLQPPGRLHQPAHAVRRDQDRLRVQPDAEPDQLRPHRLGVHEHERADGLGRDAHPGGGLRPDQAGARRHDRQPRPPAGLLHGGRQLVRLQPLRPGPGRRPARAGRHAAGRPRHAPHDLPGAADRDAQPPARRVVPGLGDQQALLQLRPLPVRPRLGPALRRPRVLGGRADHADRRPQQPAPADDRLRARLRAVVLRPVHRAHRGLLQGHLAGAPARDVPEPRRHHRLRPDGAEQLRRHSGLRVHAPEVPGRVLPGVLQLHV